MSVAHFERLCRGGVGRAVEIRTRSGQIHRGVISRVGGGKVYLRPLGNGRGYGGRGYGYYGYPGPGFGWGFGFGVAFGAIATLAFIPFFL